MRVSVCTGACARAPPTHARHPQGTTDSLIVEAGQLNKFDDKYGDLGELSEVETMDKAMAKKDEKK